MTYYDSIAAQWHAATGHKGGPFKEHILNRELLGLVEGIDEQSVLELGAGNGYFMPLLLRRFSGQVPARIVITDQSVELLRVAQRTFKIDGAEYLQLDVSRAFSFANDAFELILATMIFQELPATVLRQAAAECYRTLTPGGHLLATVIHPDFVDDLARRGQLRPYTRSIHTMPGAGSLRLPVVRRSVDGYRDTFCHAGFDCTAEEVGATPKLLRAKPGLRHASRVPIALILDCSKPRDDKTTAGAQQ